MIFRKFPKNIFKTLTYLIAFLIVPYKNGILFYLLIIKVKSALF